MGAKLRFRHNRRDTVWRESGSESCGGEDAYIIKEEIGSEGCDGRDTYISEERDKVRELW